MPMISSKYHMNKKLRLQLKFPGLIVSDFAELINLHDYHMVSPSHKESVRIAFTDTSIDMVMMPAGLQFNSDMRELIEQGAIPESRIDESVRRILTFKKSLGLLNQPLAFTVDDPAISTVGQESDWELSLEACRDAATLLKNDGDVLPLAPDANILLTGPTANSLTSQSGGRLQIPT